jgi:hypothetical protein
MTLPSLSNLSSTKRAATAFLLLYVVYTSTLCGCKRVHLDTLSTNCGREVGEKTTYCGICVHQSTCYLLCAEVPRELCCNFRRAIQLPRRLYWASDAKIPPARVLHCDINILALLRIGLSNALLVKAFSETHASDVIDASMSRSSIEADNTEALVFGGLRQLFVQTIEIHLQRVDYPNILFFIYVTMVFIVYAPYSNATMKLLDASFPWK